MISLYAILAVSSFVNVFLLGFQSKNVQRSRYVAAFMTSIGICTAQYVFVRVSVTGDPALFLLVSGISGAIGICCAIWVHDHMDGWLERLHRAVTVDPTDFDLADRWRKL